MKLCGSGDDIWFWGMAVRNGTRIKVVPDADFSLSFVPSSQEVALWRMNDAGGENDVMMLNLLEGYPELLEIIGRD